MKKDLIQCIASEKRRCFTPDALSTIDQLGFPDGKVLHYMDFTKISSWEDTGYFLTANAIPAAFALDSERGLQLASVYGDRDIDILFTGNEIPHNLTEYTVKVKFAFAPDSAEQGYFGLIMGQTSTADCPEGSLNSDGTIDTIVTRNTTLTYDNGCISSHGAHDGPTVSKKLVDRMHRGEEITLTLSFVKRRLHRMGGEPRGNVRVAVGTHCEMLERNCTEYISDAWSGVGGYMGVIVGGGAQVYIKSVHIIAGVDEESAAFQKAKPEMRGYSSPLWPEGEYELVQTVRPSPVRVNRCDAHLNDDGSLKLLVYAELNIKRRELFSNVGLCVTVVADGAQTEYEFEIPMPSEQKLCEFEIPQLDAQKVHTVILRAFVRKGGERIFDLPVTATVAKHFASEAYGTVPPFRYATVLINEGDEMYGAVSALYTDADADEYRAYLKKLQAAGFAEYTSRTENGNLFATYHSDKTILNVGYISFNKMVRISAEQKAKSALPRLKSDCGEIITTPQLTQLNAVCSFVIRLSDGRFLVHDGGLLEEKNYEGLWNQLCAQNVTGQKPVVAAWMFSHMHNDHVGAFFAFAEKYAAQIELQSIVINIPGYGYITRDDPTLARTALMNKQIALLKEAISKHYGEVPIIIPHTGQVMWFGDAEVRILYTNEDLFPIAMKNTNDSSTVYQIRIAGQTVMLLGDCQEIGSQIMLKMFGGGLKSDIVQLSHHCFNGGDAFMYAAVGADSAIWTNDYRNVIREELYRPDLLIDTNHFDVNSVKENLLIDQSVNPIMILPLPYTVGTSGGFERIFPNQIKKETI